MARNEQTFTQFGGGAFGASRPTARSDETVETYLGNARYHFSDHSTAYARFATGYRPGGPNFLIVDTATGQPVGPVTFEADRLKSYELGWKAETSDRRYGLDAAVYYIDWTNIQIGITRGGFGFTGNAPGGASVRGAELAFTMRPLDALVGSAAFTYQDAQLSEADADLGGTKGQQLPNVPKFSGTMNIDYQFGDRVAAVRRRNGSLCG